MKVTKQLRTETGHRLTNYVGRCAHLHGHSYLWEVTARSSQLDEKNMVMDFKDLKKAMNTVLDPLDHCMVLAPDDPLLSLSAYVGHPEGGCTDITLSQALHPTNDADAEPRMVIWHDNPTAESFAAWALENIEAELQRLWDAKLCDIHQGFSMPYFISNVRVWETATSYAEASSGEG